jgi:hypothetical protein
MKFLGARPQHEDLKLLVEDSDAVEGNLAEFDANGNPIDSGISPSNLIQGLSLVQNGSFEIVDSNSLPWCWEKNRVSDFGTGYGSK